MTKRGVILYSGLSWMCIGLFLFSLGLNLLVKAAQNEMGYFPWLSVVAPYVGGLQNSVILLITLALAVGYFKGKMVLAKTASRNVTRLSCFKERIKWSQIHSPLYYLLIALMMGMGMLFNLIGLASDIRGFIDLAVGSALINGSMTYFRSWMLSINKGV